MFASEKTLITAEIAAVISSLLYTWLYLNNNTLCWFFAFIGALLFLLLCIRKRILAEAFLQIFYMIMAVYGYTHSADAWIEKYWSTNAHLLLLSSSVVATFISYRLLKSKTSALLPLVDSFTTVFAISGTILMVNMVHLNWLYWVAVDAVSIYLYFKRGMKYGALLFFIYLAMAIDGLFRLNYF